MSHFIFKCRKNYRHAVGGTEVASHLLFPRVPPTAHSHVGLTPYTESGIKRGAKAPRLGHARTSYSKLTRKRVPSSVLAPSSLHPSLLHLVFDFATATLIAISKIEKKKRTTLKKSCSAKETQVLKETHIVGNHKLFSSITRY